MNYFEIKLKEVSTNIQRKNWQNFINIKIYIKFTLLSSIKKSQATRQLIEQPTGFNL
jgi:hypothetical protein